jgi:3'-phosphoadenosine 5'-phosphosulfate sulfotransferase (PAPS reductase)/FAD synthetase
VKKEQMHDPFKIYGPPCISFSGGRTSAYMLWRVLQSNSGLPADALVCFANTGREEEATLRFVQDCAEQWGVPLHWIEYRRAKPYFALTDFAGAARDGEPFAELIRSKMYLPNPMTRFCTSELKIRPMFRWLRDTGRLADGLDMMVGIRADEMRRVVKMRNGKNSESAKITNLVPLADAGVTVGTVQAFWAVQPFNLELPTYNGRTLAGNCDLCFLKPAAQVASLIREKPARAIWWVAQEDYAKSIQNTPGSRGIRFRWDRPSYAQMAQITIDQADMFDESEEAAACFCGE